VTQNEATASLADEMSGRRQCVHGADEAIAVIQKERAKWLAVRRNP